MYIFQIKKFLDQQNTKLIIFYFFLFENKEADLIFCSCLFKIVKDSFNWFITDYGSIGRLDIVNIVDDVYQIYADIT